MRSRRHSGTLRNRVVSGCFDGTFRNAQAQHKFMMPAIPDVDSLFEGSLLAPDELILSSCSIFSRLECSEVGESIVVTSSGVVARLLPEGSCIHAVRETWKMRIAADFDMKRFELVRGVDSGQWFKAHSLISVLCNLRYCPTEVTGIFKIIPHQRIRGTPVARNNVWMKASSTEIFVRRLRHF